jgi:filamentous hemagglutinin family protein
MRKIKFSTLIWSAAFSLFVWNNEVSRESFAQVIPDNTLRQESSIVDNKRTINGIPSHLIRGGASRGSNLFHSFQEFNVLQGRGIYFSNPDGIQNILMRVTGNNLSNIFGRLGVLGNANLFFLNPNGIIFGSGASLDVNGSFVGTTANSIIFADGTEFNSNSSNQPILTVSVPIGLGFGKKPGAIEVRDTGYFGTSRDFESRIRTSPINPFTPANGRSVASTLEVPEEKTIALLGGNISLNGGVVTAPSGHIELGGITGGNVFFDISQPKWNFSYENAKGFEDIRLSAEALANVSGFSNGTIGIIGENIVIDTGAILLNQQVFGQQGAIEINASSVEILGGTVDRDLVTPENFQAISARAFIVSPVIGEIRFFFNPTSVYAEALRGNGGTIDIVADRLTINDGAQLILRNFGTSTQGNISVKASDNIEVGGASGTPTFAENGFEIYSTLTSTNFGQSTGATINLQTENLLVEDGGALGSVTLGNGQGGDLNIFAKDTVNLNGFVPSALLLSTVGNTTYSDGNTGDLTIDTSRLVIQNGAIVGAFSLADGNSGNLRINASESISATGADFDSSEPGFISSGVIGGNGISETVRRIFQLPEIPTGNAGNITLNTPKFTIADRSQISVQNQGTGNAGTLEINSSAMSLDNSGAITAATASGEGGNITIDSSDIRLNNNSTITATAGGTGNGGDVTINTDTLAALDNSDITANAFRGNGGNISITTLELFQDPQSDITASSQFGIDGTVEIEILQPLEEESLAPRRTINTENLLAISCFNRTDTRPILTNSGQRGLPMNPDTGFDNSTSAIEIPKPDPRLLQTQPQPTPTVEVAQKRPWQFGDPVVEPNREVLTPDGKLLFVYVPEDQRPVSPQELLCPATQ